MSAPANTARAEEPEDEFGPDLLSDPTFVPCRVESCPRKELHREHDVPRLGRKTHQGYDRCPNCQTPVVVTKTKRKGTGANRKSSIVKAECPTCGWFHTKALKKTEKAD